MKYAALIVAVFSARFFATAIVYPPLDGDLAWQRWLGARILATHAIPHALGRESFAAVGSFWLPQEWAFSIAAALARGGLAWDLFSGALAAAATLALLLAAKRAERLGASPRAIALCTTCAGIALFASFGVRAQIVGWPLVVLVLLALEAESPWCYAVFPLAALWSNLHASAMIVPALAGLVAFGVVLERRRFDATVRRHVVLFFGTLVAICCNPFGWGLPMYAIELFLSPIKHYISEWQPSDLGVAAFGFGSLPLLLVALVLFGRARLRPRDLVVFAALAFLSLSAVRNVPLFSLVALPLVAVALTRVVPWFAAETGDAARPHPLATFGLPAFSLVLAVVVAVGLLRATERNGDLAQPRALAALVALPGDHRVLCTDFAWCSHLLGHAHASVFLDGRADPFPPDVWTDYVTIVRLDPAWSQRVAARRIDTILAGTGAPLDQALARTAPWRLAYANATYHLWTRRDGAVALDPSRAVR